MASTQRLLALGLLVTIITASSAQGVMTLNFDTDAMGDPIVAGQIIDDEYDDWGVQIEAVNFNRTFDLAIAFDTLAPTGGDWDLRTDDGRYGPGNNAPLGNVMILSERGKLNHHGNVKVPDDEGHRPAGYFDLTYDDDQIGGQVIMLDVDSGENGAIELFHHSILQNSIAIAAVGDNSVQSLTLGNMAFDQMRINMGGSGAVATVTTNTGTLHLEPIPEPATMLLTGLALAALAHRSLKRPTR